MKRAVLFFAILAFSAFRLPAQVNVGIPSDVFYLMPEMTSGTLRFTDRFVNGKFNICAVDQTLRFLDEKGEELALDDDSQLLQVNFGDLMFVHADHAFYRLYPVSEAAYVAVKRDVTVMTDTRRASYGMDSQTTAVQEVGVLDAGGHVINFNDVRQYPYQMTEMAYLYRNGRIVPFSKKNCLKAFPAKKAEIEAWFAENKKAADVDTVITRCKQWGN